MDEKLSTQITRDASASAAEGGTSYGGPDNGSWSLLMVPIIVTLGFVLCSMMFFN